MKEFVNMYQNTLDIQLNPKLTPKFWFSIPPTNSNEKVEAAHYFLLAASITETAVIGNSRNVRILLHHLHRNFGENLYKIQEALRFKEEVENCERKHRLFSPLGEKKDQIPGILASVNKFVNDYAGWDLTRYSATLVSNGKKPEDFVEILGKNVRRMGGAQKGKAWLYMKWMVRDLKLFEGFSPKDLFIPLTTPTLRVAVALNLINDGVKECLRSVEKIKKWWKNHDMVRNTYKKIKEYAEKLFPDDPLKVDYPFFILGRWLSGFDLTVKVLCEHLEFFKRTYEKIKKVPFQLLVLKEHSWGWGPGSFERSVARILEKHNIRPEYEFIQFNLPEHPNLHRNPTYTPDFIYPKLVNGKKLFLEPHGIEMGLKEALIKYSLFRETYGKYCAIALIVPKNIISSVRRENKAYDYLWSEHELSEELKLLEKESTYKNNH